VIEITVAKNGEPTEIQSLEGHPLLISATIEAAKQWRFQPYRLNGKAVELDTKVTVIFESKPRPGPRCTIEFPRAAVKAPRACPGATRIP
jgi:hypothetical protein